MKSVKTIEFEDSLEIGGCLAAYLGYLEFNQKKYIKNNGKADWYLTNEIKRTTNALTKLNESKFVVVD